MKAVLVVDSQFDAATDLLMTALADHEANVPVFRMDTAQFPVELGASARIGRRGWEGSLRLDHRSVTLAEVGAVYWNRPHLYRMPEGLSAPDAQWARGAARHGLGGLLLSLPVTWMNHPTTSSQAEFKPLQLTTAQQAGLRVPRTLVTNEPDAVRDFAKAAGGPIVTKPLGSPDVAHARSAERMYCRLLDPGELDSPDALDSVAMTAHLFQEQVSKAFEVRLTVVGRTCHSVRIDAGSAAARTDWRSDYGALSYTAIDTPCAVAESVAVYMRALGLTYAAMDFVVDPDERWWFLEANPAGQWAWLNPYTGLANAMADALIRWCRT